MKAAKIILRILLAIVLILALAVCALLFIPLTENADDTPVRGSEKWMADLDDALPLNRIAIPGTHDSATKYVQLAFFSKCQSKTVGEQLEAGYHYLDIRLGDDMTLMHGFTSCKTGPYFWSPKLTLDDVLADCRSFLDEHPTETVLFVVKHEHGDMTAAEFEASLRSVIDSAPEKWLIADAMPTLGEARGKIVLFRRWEGSLGIPLLWRDQSGDMSAFSVAPEADGRLWVQDMYKLGAEDKWTAFITGIREADHSPDNTVISFLSTNGTAAYGHPYAEAVPLNDRLMSYPLADDPGWVIADFASAKMAEKIYAKN